MFAEFKGSLTVVRSSTAVALYTGKAIDSQNEGVCTPMLRRTLDIGKLEMGFVSYCMRICRRTRTESTLAKMVEVNRAACLTTTCSNQSSLSTPYLVQTHIVSLILERNFQLAQ